MTKNKTAVIKSYKVLIPCRNDKTVKSFAVGDTVTKDDFSAAVIKNWLDIGVLKAVT